MQHIYWNDCVVSSFKTVHPCKDGSLQTEALKTKELAVSEEKEEIKEEENIDPRWDKLKQLLTDK
jgi:uncharacterized metal-binding protein YceD (DUF177 family)